MARFAAQWLGKRHRAGRAGGDVVNTDFEGLGHDFKRGKVGVRGVDCDGFDVGLKHLREITDGPNVVTPWQRAPLLQMVHAENFAHGSEQFRKEILIETMGKIHAGLGDFVFQHEGDELLGEE